MDVMIERCCGLDVHLATVMACVIVSDRAGKARVEKREFSSMTHGLRELAAWLKERNVTHVAMESTGAYWMPVYAILEQYPFDLTVANAQHIKNVPGRKTDMNDAEWIARLLRAGLLRKSFVPGAEFRAIRELTRHRRRLTNDRTREVNRLHKVLAQANVKLAVVISDVFGVSGVEMVQAMIAGEKTHAQIARLARGKMRSKIPDIERALEGNLLPHHKMLLQMQLEHIEQINNHLAVLDAEIARRFEPYEAQIAMLDSIPGLDRKAIEDILAETGVDMSSFPNEHKIAAWSGTSPGNNKSAGKDLGSRRRLGNIHLTTVLVEAAQSAARSKGTYLADKFHRLKSRRGHKRAALAIARKIIESVYRILTTGQPYKDLGSTYLDRRDRDKCILHLLRRLEALGLAIPPPSSAPTTEAILA